MSWLLQKQVEVENVELADREVADLNIKPLDDAKKGKKVKEEKVIVCHCVAVYCTALPGNRTPDTSKPAMSLQLYLRCIGFVTYCLAQVSSLRVYAHCAIAEQHCEHVSLIITCRPRHLIR